MFRLISHGEYVFFILKTRKSQKNAPLAWLSQSKVRAIWISCVSLINYALHGFEDVICVEIHKNSYSLIH